MKNTVILLTNNKRKKKSFQKSIDKYNIIVETKSLWLPEIQSDDNREIAAFAAEYGSNILKKPVVKMDSGFFIEGINNFPGPLVSYVDKQVGADLFFEVLKNLKNKKASIRNSLAYCEPGQKPVIFESGCKGSIVNKITLNKGSFIDKLFVPHHPKNPNKKTMGEIRKKDYDAFLYIWGNAELQFAEWFIKRK